MKSKGHVDGRLYPGGAGDEPSWGNSTGCATAVVKPYNMVFILVDDLRYDAMGFLTPGLNTPQHRLSGEERRLFSRTPS